MGLKACKESQEATFDRNFTILYYEKSQSIHKKDNEFKFKLNLIKKINSSLTSLKTYISNLSTITL